MTNALSEMYRTAKDCGGQTNLPSAVISLRVSFDGWTLIFSETKQSSEITWHACRIEWHGIYLVTAGGYTTEEMLNKLEGHLTVLLDGLSSANEYFLKLRSVIN